MATRVLGIPAGFLVVLGLVLVLGAGAALAAITMRAPISINGQVSAVPNITWTNGAAPQVSNRVGATVTATVSGGTLSINVASIYPGGSFSVAAPFVLPDGSPSGRVTGIDLGVPGLTAVIEETMPPLGSFPVAKMGTVVPPGTTYAIRFTITVAEDVPIGAFTSVNAALMLEMV